MEMTTILDQPEQRFPIDIATSFPKIRDLYQSATRNQWDPRTDVDWDLLDPDSYSDEQREAARLWWSRRGWGEYGAVSESPAMIVRFYRDHLPTELALFFTIRSQEEARHAEACYLMAERLGGWVPEPQVKDFESAVSTHGVRKMALDPDTSVEMIFSALILTLEEYAFDWFRLMVEGASNPVANRVLRLIMRDEIRHCAFGWSYMEQRMPLLSETEKERVRQAAIHATEQVELTGYRVPWMAADSEATRIENEIDRLTWEAGLGASVEEAEKPVFVSCIQRVRRKFAGIGIDLPMFHHPKIGEF